jgi:hypothetical protein
MVAAMFKMHWLKVFEIYKKNSVLLSIDFWSQPPIVY